MAEPLFLYRTQAETILEILQGRTAAGGESGTVVAKLEAGIRNLSNPVRLLLDPPEAAALEKALLQSLPAQQQLQEPWATILRRTAILRGQVPQRHWRSR